MINLLGVYNKNSNSNENDSDSGDVDSNNDNDNSGVYGNDGSVGNNNGVVDGKNK
jgi:hypothetical protein